MLSICTAPNRHQPPRIDAEEPWLEVFIGEQVDEAGFPLDTLEVEKDAEFLRARRAHKVQHMHALPVEHFAGLDVVV